MQLFIRINLEPGACHALAVQCKKQPVHRDRGWASCVLLNPFSLSLENRHRKTASWAPKVTLPLSKQNLNIRTLTQFTPV